MRSPIDLERQVVFLEQRVPANVNILMQGGSPWRSFRSDPKVLRPDVASAIEHAFDCGGYIAGGCARWLRSINNKVTAINRGAYIHEGGDIDIFFRTQSGWRDYVARYLNAKGSPTVRLSDGRLAANLVFAPGKRTNPSGYSETPTMQAICCVTGVPDEVLRGFDFQNSMVAFDRETTWIADDWHDIERERTLKVSWWGSRSIAYRIAKYMTKYGYQRFVNASDAMFEQLVSGTNSMSDKQKAISRGKWQENLYGDVCSVETKLLILASTAQGIETDDLFTLTKNNVERVWIGSYENAITHLLERQQKANGPDYIPSKYSDPYGFSAAEYCWHV